MIIGIDPGKSGALAALYADGTGDAIPTPLTGGEIDCRAVLRFLDGREPVRLVVLEQVAARPGQGVSSMFSFGKSYGIMIGIIEAAGIPYRLVTPQAWKKRVLAGTTKDKDAAISFVRRAYPTIDLTPGKKRTPHDGIADAVCLAEWGRQELAGSV